MINFTKAGLSCAPMFSGYLDTKTWRVLGLRTEETDSRYGG